MNMFLNVVPSCAPTVKLVFSSSAIVSKGFAWLTTERKDVYEALRKRD